MWALSSNAGRVEESEREGALALLSHIRNAGVWVQGSRFVAKRYTEILEMVGNDFEMARSTFASSSDAMRKALDWELDPVSGLASTAFQPRDPK